MKRFWKVRKRPAGYFKANRTAMMGKGIFLFGYKLLMSGNQSFNQSLYAPLTQPPLPCQPQDNFPKDGVHEA
jgi:hypothetical protein